MPLYQIPETFHFQTIDTFMPDNVCEKQMGQAYNTITGKSIYRPNIIAQLSQIRYENHMRTIAHIALNSVSPDDYDEDFHGDIVPSGYHSVSHDCTCYECTQVADRTDMPND